MEIIRSPGIEAAIKKNSYSIEIGGMSEFHLERALDQRPFSLGDSARDIMQSLDFGTLAKAREIRVTKVTLGDLGFTGFPTRAHVFDQAPKLGLALLPAEAGPHARLQDRNQHIGDWYCIAMNPIADRFGHPNVFRVIRNAGVFLLYSHWTIPGSRWSPDTAWVFGLRK